MKILEGRTFRAQKVPGLNGRRQRLLNEIEGAKLDGILIAIAMSPILQQPLKDGEVKNKIVHDENINLGCDLIEVLSRRSVRRRLFPP